MERRRKSLIITIPDAINCSTVKDFTQIPNELIRNPLLTGKAKAILCLLLSNKIGWVSHAVSIQNFMSEKKEAISTGLKELELFGYLIRFQTRNKDSKTWEGSFWAYTDTPFVFNIEDQLAQIKQLGLEIPDESLLEPLPDYPSPDKPSPGEPSTANQQLKRLINKKTNNLKDQKKKLLPKITKSQFDKFWESWPKGKKGPKGKALVKWNNLCSQKDKKNIPSWQRIRASIKKQKETDKWERGYIPYAITWLNNKAWLDDPTEWAVGDFSKKSPKLQNTHKDDFKRTYKS